MNYYFTARYSKSDPKSIIRYKSIIAQLAKLGHNNTNYVHMDPSSPAYRHAAAELAENASRVLNIQLQHLTDSDALICDLTTPSTTVGFQLSTAIAHKIPCLVLLFSAKDEVALDPVILTQQHFGLLKYAKLSQIDEIDSIIENFIADSVERPYKFNFFLPLSAHNSISKQARILGMTKSELIRRIIDEYLEQREGDR